MSRKILSLIICHEMTGGGGDDTENNPGRYRGSPVLLF